MCIEQTQMPNYGPYEPPPPWDESGLTKKQRKILDNIKCWPGDDKKALLAKIPDLKMKRTWGGVEATRDDLLWGPVTDLLFTSTGGEECSTYEECCQLLIKTQKYDMEQRGMPDIQYNFYIGGDGNLYDGRGYHTNPCKDPQFAALDNKSIDIAYIGDIKDIKGRESVEKMTKLFEQFLYDHDYVTEDYKITTTVDLGSNVRDPSRVTFVEKQVSSV